MYAQVSSGKTEKEVAIQLSRDPSLDYADCKIGSLMKKCADTVEAIRIKKRKKRKDLQEFMKEEMLPPRNKADLIGVKRKLEECKEEFKSSELEKKARQEQNNQSLEECKKLRHDLAK